MGMGEHNLAVLAERAHERFGGQTTLHFEGRRIPGHEVHERSTRLGEGFRALGVEPGDRVVVFMANRPEVGVVYAALWRAGAIITPAIFLLPAPDLRHILEDSEAVAIVTTPEFVGVAREAAEGVPSIKWVIVAEAAPEGTLALEDLEAARPGDIVPRDDDDLAAIMYTGGTTGRAKGVMLSHANLWHAAKAGQEASFVSGVNKTLVPIPLSHSYGLIVTVVGMHAVEPGEAELLRWFEPAGLPRGHPGAAAPAGHGGAVDAPAPAAAPLEDYDLSSLRFMTSGAAPLPVEAANEFERRVPNVVICEAYGLTENAAVLAVNPPLAAAWDPSGCPFRVRSWRSSARTARRWRPASRARSASAARVSCPATGARRRPPRRRSSTAGCTPATWAAWTRTATCTSSTG